MKKASKTSTGKRGAAPKAKQSAFATYTGNIVKGSAPAKKPAKKAAKKSAKKAAKK